MNANRTLPFLVALVLLAGSMIADPSESAFNSETLPPVNLIGSTQ